MAGIGKTALAVHAAHQLADQFPDGVLFTDLHGFTPDTEATPPDHVLDRLLRGLGVPGPQIPLDLEARVGLYRSVLARRRVLIVLDNAAHEAQLQPLLPATAGCMVIMTSRRHLAGLDEAVHITLPVLDPAEAVGLFRSLAGDRATSADRPAVERIVTLCGRLPLAIRITAARLRSAPATTTAALCVELEHALDTERRLTWLSDGHRTVDAALAVSYRHLTDDQQRALRLVGLHPGTDIEPYAVAALADTTVEQAGQLLADLHAASLLDHAPHRRHRLHDLVATYVAALAAELPESVRHAAVGRLFDHYAATSSLAMDLAYPWEANQRPRPPAGCLPAPGLSDQRQAQVWLDTETDNLLAAAHHAATCARGDHVLHQSTVLNWHLRTRGHYARAVLLYREALEHARATGDATAELQALNGLGHIHRLQDQYGPAIEWFEPALTIARGIGHRAGEQDALRGLGTTYRMQGQYGPAVECFEPALTIARQTGHRSGEQEALNGLGHIHRLQGRFGQATECFEAALAIAHETSHRTGEQQALRGLGSIHYMQGRYEAATECLERALVITRQTGHRYGEQDTLRGLGFVNELRGRYDAAADCYAQALVIARQIGNRASEWDALRGLGVVHYGQSRYEAAIGYFQQVLAIAHQTDDPNGQFEAHQGLGRSRHAIDDHTEALHHHQTALELAVDLDQPADQVRAHDGLAHTHHALGNPQQARHHWQTALDLLDSIATDQSGEHNVTTTTIRGNLRQLGRESAGTHRAGGR
jgi:tetratricopeptide (TPR) repeat protein